MKKGSLCFYFFLIFSLFPSYNFASSGYQEMQTSQGRVIFGLDRGKAVERFGLPASVSKELWCYIEPEKFFVYFPADIILSIQLYPKSCEALVGFPIEFKVFGHLSNFKIKDITTQVQLSINEPQNFVFEKPGFIIPKKIGEYQVLAKYKDIFSNSSYISVKTKKEAGEIKEEQLISVNILPYKPRVCVESRLNFVALGTFFQPEENKYIIKDISQKAMWFIQENSHIIEQRDSQIYFPSPGKFNVFSKYRDLESYLQEVKVEEMYSVIKHRLKHITLLPEFIIASIDNPIFIKAFGTYADNRVKDITSIVNWMIKDKEILATQKGGEFLPKTRGITEVIAELDNLKSPSVKIIVSGSEEAKKGFSLLEDKKGGRIYYKGLTKDIKNGVERIRKEFVEKGEKLKLIKIMPDDLTIPLGENRQLVAVGTYSDNYQDNLTIVGEWFSSDNRIATVSKGEVFTHSTGEVRIFVKFQGIESAPASIIVKGPKLVSIILSPENSQISMKEKLNLKAEGYFSDSSRKDISSLVTWKINDPRIIRIEGEGGSVRPLRFGKTQVYAEYSGIGSLPANIKVIFTIQWLIGMILKMMFFLLLSIIVIFMILYFITKHKKAKLLSLYKNPRKFITNLYENLKGILRIFGIRYKGFIAPISYAELVEERYSIENQVLLKLTTKFEEAKYSKHILQSEDADLVLNAYNNLLKVLFHSRDKFSLFFKYCLTLLRRKPLCIYKIKQRLKEG